MSTVGGVFREGIWGAGRRGDSNSGRLHRFASDRLAARVSCLDRNLGQDGSAIDIG